MMKKAFISSTYRDLPEYRSAAAVALERLGLAVGRMEVFGARPDEPQNACFDEIQGCELFVGIYAHRYGYIPEGSRKSITEQEFDKALQLDKPIFCFVLHEDHPWPPKLVEDDSIKSRLNEFKERMRKLRVLETFTTPDDLGVKVATSVGRHLNSAAAKELAERVQDRMSRAGIGVDGLASGNALTDLADAERKQITAMTADLTERVRKLLTDRSTVAPPVDPRSLRVTADGLMAECRWLDAGQAYEAYAKHAPDDWEASYLRGVGYANARGGKTIDRLAVRAVSDAITYLPMDAAPNTRARLFAYRGAMWKRLGRLEEALADLAIAQRHASARYEVEDVLYNIACVHALAGDREGMLQAVRALAARNSSRLSNSIRPHLHDYFARFCHDHELLSLLEGTP